MSIKSISKKMNKAFENAISKKIKTKKVIPINLKNREVIKDQSKVIINTNQPVYSQDKSRFFKKAWEVEKRQLYFDN